MPFIGVRPDRAHLFEPRPRCLVAVNDAAAWRLYPSYRQVYDKLSLALDAGLRAAPCGVDPRDCGIAADEWVFVKPIVNLAGMAVGARLVRVDQVPHEPGSFWCEALRGAHTSTDALVRQGEVLWLAHTLASKDKDQERPLYWEIGVHRPEIEPWIRAWVARHLAGYTGICNLELIGGRPIEAHLRGSNGFFDFYGPDFMPAWVALVEGQDFNPPPPVPGGCVISVFGEVAISAARRAAAEALGVRIDLDAVTPGRSAILRCRDLAAGLAALARIRGQSAADEGARGAVG